MGRKQFDRSTNLSRSAPHRTPRNRLLIVSGAAVTERDYFQGLRDHLENPAVTVKLLEKAGSPSQVVEYARKRRADDRDGYDEVWCVVDVDEFTDLPRAMKNARDEGIRMAVSNPCFEVWLLLHFEEHRAHCASYKELLPRLKKHMPGYSKTALRFTDYAGGFEDACHRAKRLDSSGEDYCCNPSTGVWPIVEQMSAGRRC
jgi:hypothetical protein